MSNEDSLFWEKIKKLALIVGIIAPIGILIASWIKIQNTDTLLELQILNKENLTPKKDIRELRGVYFYNDTIIQNLWLLDIKIINNGTETILGEGNRKTIVGDDISFTFSDSFSLIKFEILKNDIDAKIKEQSSGVSLNFLQWRANEEMRVKLYLSSTNQSIVPNMTTKRREIIDGDIVINENLDNSNKAFNSGLDYLPKMVATIGRIGGIFFNAILFILAILFISTGLGNLRKILKWRRKYYSKYQEYMKTNYKHLSKTGIIHSHHSLVTLLKNPFKLSIKSKVWKEANIPEYPVGTNLNDNILALVFAVIGILFSFTSVLGLLIFH